MLRDERRFVYSLHLDIRLYLCFFGCCTMHMDSFFVGQLG